MSEHYSDNPAFNAGTSNNVTDAEKEDVPDSVEAVEPEPEIVEAQVLDPLPDLPVENDESAAADGDPGEPSYLDSPEADD